MAFDYSKILPRVIGILRIFSVVLAVGILLATIYVVNQTGIAMKSNQLQLERLENERDTLKKMDIAKYQKYKGNFKMISEEEFNKRYGPHEKKILPLAEMRAIRNSFRAIIGILIVFLIYYTVWFLVTKKYKIVIPPSGIMWKIDLMFNLIGGFILYSIAVNLTSLVPFAREAQSRGRKLCDQHTSYAGNKPMEVEYYYASGGVHYIFLRCVGTTVQKVRIGLSGASVFLAVIYMFVGLAKIAIYKYRKAKMTVAPTPTSASNTATANAGAAENEKPPVGTVDNWTGECL